MNWIYAYAQVIAGAFCGLAFGILVYIIAQLIAWKLDHTNFIALSDNEFQCLHCNTTVNLERGSYDLRYCPHCGRQVEKVIDK